MNSMYLLFPVFPVKKRKIIVTRKIEKQILHSKENSMVEVNISARRQMRETLLLFSMKTAGKKFSLCASQYLSLIFLMNVSIASFFFLGTSSSTSTSLMIKVRSKKISGARKPHGC